MLTRWYRSRFRDWYVWSETEPPNRFEGMVFPRRRERDVDLRREAGAWYRHRFYRFEPDLNTLNAGFSCADPEELVAPVVDFGPYGYERVNVTAQRLDPHSLLTWFERILHALRECAEIGSGDHEIIDAGPAHVLVHRADGDSGSTLFAHNLADRPCTLQLGSQHDREQRPLSFFADSDYGRDVDLDAVDVAGFGYRWIRLRQAPGS